MSAWPSARPGKAALIVIIFDSIRRDHSERNNAAEGSEREREIITRNQVNALWPQVEHEKQFSIPFKSNGNCSFDKPKTFVPPILASICSVSFADFQFRSSQIRGRFFQLFVLRSRSSRCGGRARKNGDKLLSDIPNA